jgi:DNA-binding MltR family transcriptional regulator
MARKPIPRGSPEFLGDLTRTALVEPPLSIALLFHAALENSLMHLLASFLIKGETTDSMFKTRGELGSFFSCFRVAYTLGLISKEAHDNLLLIGEIRNLFAHSTSMRTFSYPEIGDKCKKLTLPSFILSQAHEGIMKRIKEFPVENERKTGAVNQSKFVNACLALIGYIMAVDESIKRRELMDDAPHWKKVQEHFERAGQIYEQQVNPPTPESPEKKEGP